MKIKSEFIGILLLIGAALLMFNTNVPSSKTTAVTQKVETNELSEPIIPIRSEEAILDEKISPTHEKCTENIFTIENDSIIVQISDVDGAIKMAQLKNYKAAQDEPELVTFNEGSKVNSLAVWAGDKEFSEMLQAGKFRIISSSDTQIVLEKTLNDRCSVVRKYSLTESDSKQASSYVVDHEFRIKNTGEHSLNLGQIGIFLGAMPSTPSDPIGDYLNFGTYNGQKDFFIKLRNFKASNGFFGLGKKNARGKISSNEKIFWGSIKNQFFTAVLTPKVQADGYISYPVKLAPESLTTEEDGIAAAMLFNVPTLSPKEEYSLTSEFYIGPKDFAKLSSLGNEQGRIMQFGFFGSISELLLRLMLKIHAVIPNWGWTIIILTTIIKLLLWPLTNAQVKSSKKMAAIQQPLKILKEKYKNNPQKLQAETLQLFKENQINPAAGCLPIFIQIPIFFGLYYMLRTSSDLRFAHFLWIKDLSLPDTVAHIGAFPINILPIIMGITMFAQMQMTPMPTSDNSQKIMFKLMPAIFLLCCYSFPSGLVLYWTVQNLLTIAQQLAAFRNKDLAAEIVTQKSSTKNFGKHSKKSNKRGRF